MAVLLCALALVPLSTTAAADEGDIDDKLEQAIDDYLDAQQVLQDTKAEQENIETEIAETKEKVDVLRVEVADFAVNSYMNGGVPSAVAVLATNNPDDAVDSLTTTGFLGQQSAAELTDLKEAEADLEAKEEALEDEVADAEEAEEEMAAAQSDAAQAMATSGGNWDSGPAPGDFPKAEPAPRNPDGSLPEEGCSEPDPVMDGACITPRTQHAYEQAIIAGFTREISNCYRSLQDGGDHPSGRACDYTVGSQGGYASGEAMTYGDNCAAWFVENADALGVKGIIWYNQLWTPATGWGPYSGGNTGDPSLDHANHVHVSMLLPAFPPDLLPGFGSYGGRPTP